MVADSAWTSQEQHGGRYVRRENHGVVAGAACHAMHGIAGRLNAARQLVAQTRVQSDRGLVEMLLAIELNAATLADLPGSRKQCGDARMAGPVSGMTYVETDARQIGNHVRRVWFRGDRAHRGCEAGLAESRFLHMTNPLGSGRESVPPQ